MECDFRLYVQARSTADLSFVGYNHALKCPKCTSTWFYVSNMLENEMKCAKCGKVFELVVNKRHGLALR